MRNTWKRILAMLLCVVMCVSLLPVSALAEDGTIALSEETGNGQIEKYHTEKSGLSIIEAAEMVPPSEEVPVLESDATEPESIPIDDEHFPDNIFRAYVEENLDSDGDGFLTDSECALVQTIDVNGLGISSLAGIGCFRELKTLKAANNSLNELDLSGLAKLHRLCCYNSGIKELDIADCPLLYETILEGSCTSKTDDNDVTYVQYQITGTNYLMELDRDCVCYTEDEGIRIDAVNFPDTDFRIYVWTDFDSDCSGFLSDEEIAAATEIFIGQDYDVSNVAGIEFFTELKSLTIEKNPHLTSLDLRANTNLTQVEVCSNGLTELKLDGLTKIEELFCDNNTLTELELDSLMQLKELSCNSNALTELDVSEFTLTELCCYRNPLSSLVLGEQPELKRLECFYVRDSVDDDDLEGYIKTLDIRESPYLVDAVLHPYDDFQTEPLEGGCAEYYGCLRGKLNVCSKTELIIPGSVAVDADNFPDDAFREYVSRKFDWNHTGWLTPEEITRAKSISMDNVADLSSAEGIEFLTKLTTIELTGNANLTSLNLSSNTKITSLALEENGLTRLNVTGFSELTDLNCSNNALHELDVSTCTKLTELYVAGNPLTTLTLGSQEDLKFLFCYSSDLAELDIAGCPLLLDAYQNGERIERSYCVEYKSSATGARLLIDEDTEIIGVKEYEDAVYTWNKTENSYAVTALKECKEYPEYNITETVDATYSVTTEPTCTDTGVGLYTAAFTDPVFETQTKTEEIPATGHDYKLTGWFWTADYSSAQAKFTCSHDESHAVTEKATVQTETIPSTPEQNGSITYTATVMGPDGRTYTDTKTEVIPATGYTYQDPVYSWDGNKVTATMVCNEDETKNIVETVTAVYSVTKAATCEEPGEGLYIATFTNNAFETQTKTEEIPAAGHKLVKTAAATATCEEPGNSEYWACSVCGKYFRDAEGKTEIAEDSWLIPATGHDWDTPTYEWAADNSGVTATHICKNDATHQETETVSTTYKITTPATCTEPGVKTWTSAGFRNEAFAVQTKETEIEATGHRFAVTYVWSKDNSGVTAIAVCANDASHLVTETVETAYKVTKEPTAAETGTGVYTAEFESELFTKQTKEVEIPALEVSYVISETSLAIPFGETRTLTVRDDKGNVVTADWSSSDNETASVKSGVVTANKVGTVTITAMAGGSELTCKVLVQFTDVTDPTLFYYDPIYNMVDQGVIGGYDDGTFRPNGNCNRAAVVTFLWRLAGKPEPEVMATFSDMPTDNEEFCKAISWAAEEGITTGYAGNLFKPWNTCNRAAIVTFLWRYAGSPSPTKIATFKDMTTNDDFNNAISWAAENGITTGWDDNTFRPWNTCNRLAVASFLDRYSKL